MSLPIAFLAILAVATVVGGIVAGLAMLALRQKQRLSRPLIQSVCPECGIRFGLTVPGYVHEIKTSADLIKGESHHGIIRLSTVIAFDCPRCRTPWKYGEGVLEKDLDAPAHRSRLIPFAWLAPLLTQSPVYAFGWRVYAFGWRVYTFGWSEITSFLGQKELFLYLSWFFATALWSVILPSFPPFYADASFGRRIEYGFVFMILGLLTGTIAYFRCREKRFAGLAIGINSLPVIFCICTFAGILESFMWAEQMSNLYGHSR